MLILALVASIPLSLGTLSIDPAQACACNGNEWSQPELLTDPSALAEDLHTVTIGNTVFAVWVDQTLTSRVMTSSSSDVGVTWSTPEIISEDSHSPIIVASSDDLPSLFFIHDEGQGRSTIMTTERLADAQTWPTPTEVVSDADNADEFSYLTAAALPNGEFALSWIYLLSVSTTSNSIGFSLSNQGLWTAPQPFGAVTPSADVSYTGIELTSGTLDGSPALVLSWNKIDNNSSTQDVEYIWSSIPQDLASWDWFTAQAWSPIESLSADVAYRVHTEAVPSGGFVFGWLEYEQGGTTIRFAGLYDPQGVTYVADWNYYGTVYDNPRFRIGPNDNVLAVFETEEEDDFGDPLPTLVIMQFNVNGDIVLDSSSAAQKSLFSRELSGINTDYERPWPSVSEDGYWLVPYVEATQDGDNLYVMQGQDILKPGAPSQPVIRGSAESLGWVESVALSNGTGVLAWMAETSSLNYTGQLFASSRTTNWTGFSLTEWTTPLATPDISGFADKMSYWRNDFTVVDTASGFSAMWLELDENQKSVVATSQSTDGEVWSDPVWLSDPADYIRYINVDTNSSGSNVFVSWASGNYIDYVEVPIVSASSDSGTTWTTPMVLSQIDGVAPVITATDAFNAVAITNAWVDGSSSLSTTIDAGITWTPFNLEGGATQATAQFDSLGTLRVAYVVAISPGEFDVVTAKKTPHGSLLETSRTRVVAEYIYTLKLQFSPHDVNDMAVSWNTTDSEDSNDTFEVQRSSDAGATWSAPSTLAQSGFSYWGDELVWSLEGDLLIVGELYDDDSGVSSVISTRLLSESDTWSPSVVISPYDLDEYGETQISADGTLVSFIWRENIIDSSNSFYSLLSSVSTDSGLTWSDPLQVTDPELNVLDASLSVDVQTNTWTLIYTTDEFSLKRMVTTLTLTSTPQVLPPPTNETESGAESGVNENTTATSVLPREIVLTKNGVSPEVLGLGETSSPDADDSSELLDEAQPQGEDSQGSPPQNNVLFITIGALILAATSAGIIALIKMLKP